MWKWLVVNGLKSCFTYIEGFFENNLQILFISGMIVGSLLKSSSERGAFHHALEAPVSGWHITTGYPKVHPKRERRQISRLSPAPLHTKKKRNVTPTGRVIYATPTPTETGVPPLTTATHISTSLSSHNVASTAGNTPPELRQPIGQIRVYQGQGIHYLIPYNTFYDKEDSYTSNLRLDMRTTSGTELEANFWILLDSLKQEIYGLPFDSTSVGLHEFQMTATDTGGLKAYETFQVHVMEDTIRYNHEFTISFGYNSGSFMNNVEVQVSLLKKIASYYSVNFSNVRVASYDSGGSFTFRFDLIPYERCDQLLIRLVNGFWIDDTLSTNFVNALTPEFKVSSGSYRVLGPCEPKDNTPPIVYNPIGQLSVLQGQAIHYKIPYNTFFDNEDFYTPNLILEMRTLGGKELPADSWILFNSTEQEIYGMPIDVNGIGIHNFSMVATDKGGKIASNPFSVLVVEDLTHYNHAFTIELNLNYNEFVNNVDIQLSLLETIANYYGVNVDSVRVADYKPGFFFTFHFDFIPYEDCKHPRLLQLIDAFWIESKLNPNFVNALHPKFKVTDGSYHGVGPCKVSNNTSPVLLNPIGQLTVQQGKGIHFVVPYNTFYDNEDHYTPNLNLEMRTSSHTELPSNSWILFNKATQEIYGLPFDVNQIGLHKFVMFATDKEGLKTSNEFEVRVLQDPTSYNHAFTILLDYDYADFVNNVGIRLALLDKITNYFGTNFSQLHVGSYFPGISFIFQFDSIPYSQCNHPLLRKLMGDFLDKNELNPNFVSALLPEFKVTSGSFQAVGPCKQNTAPEVINPIKQLNIYQGQALQYPISYNTFYDKQDSYTPNLELEMRMSDNTNVPPNFWIALNSSHLRQEIYALPVNDDTVGSHDFFMVATDKGGLEASDLFQVQVVKDTAHYNHEFTILLGIDYVSFRDNVGARVSLLDKIASYYGVNVTNMRVVKYVRGVSFTYRFDFVPYDDCDHPELQKIINGFWEDGELNPNFFDSLSEFFVTSGSYRGAEHCTFPEVRNDPPELINPIGQLKVYQGQAMRQPIHYETFFDNQDFYTHNLKLEIKTTRGKQLLPSSWILLKSTWQEMIIYGLPLDDDAIGMHKFDLVATDKGGLSAHDTIEIEVLKDPLRYNHEFTISLNYDYDTFPENVQVPLLLLDKIARYYFVNISNVRVVSYVPGISMKYRFDFVPYEVCNYPLLRKIIDGFWIKPEVNPNFVKALSPEFKVISGSYRGIGPCAIIGNDPPELYNHIDRLNVFQGQGLRYFIPNDTFYDKEDMFTPNLLLDMRTINNEELLSTSWILLNSSQQEIYGLPFNTTWVGLHQFVLVGMDSGKKKAYDAFEVQVWEDTIRYNHEFTIILSYDNATFMDNVGVRVLLLDKIAIYFAVNLTNVRVVSYLPGVVFTFRFDFVPYEICNHPFLLNLVNRFITNGKLNPNFVDALLPEFIVTSGHVGGSGPCGTVIEPTGVALKDRPPGVWWTYAIIPAIVLAIVLLLIGCCILLLMGCRRKQKLSVAEKKTFIYKRKPIVLQEEYDVKENLLKQPLVLPNEKPPVPPMYPRSPVLGGIGSEEKRSVAYQTPSFASSRTSAGGGDGGGRNVSGFGMTSSGGSGGFGLTSSSGGGGGGFGMTSSGGGGGGGGFGMTTSSGGGGDFGMTSSSGGGSGGYFGMTSSSGGGGGFSMSGSGGGMSGGTVNGSANMGGGALGMNGGSFNVSSGGRGARGSGGGIKQSSYNYSYSSSTASGGGTRKTAYSGYRLPPAYVPP